jgi:hypothetical protein
MTRTHPSVTPTERIKAVDNTECEGVREVASVARADAEVEAALLALDAATDRYRDALDARAASAKVDTSELTPHDGDHGGCSAPPTCTTGECGKCFQQREVAPCCSRHGIPVCHTCYVTHVGDPIECDLFASHTHKGEPMTTTTVHAPDCALVDTHHGDCDSLTQRLDHASHTDAELLREVANAYLWGSDENTVPLHPRAYERVLELAFLMDTPDPQYELGREAGIRQAVAWLQTDYSYGDMPEWRQQGVDWIEDMARAERVAKEADRG